MNTNSLIDQSVFNEVLDHLTKIEREHDVAILQAIESGSRAWGFPSPDSDYDVRFIYAHPRDWYLQLSEERDVIELPINDELDIAGWDIRKALNLANKGNAVIREWMISPIVYKQSESYAQLTDLVNKSFNPTSVYHHYRSMAKKAYFDIERSEQKKLKRFFYFARATLSALWVVEKEAMPSILFSDLVNELISDPEMVRDIEGLVSQKALESERSLLEVSPPVYRAFAGMYGSLEEAVFFDSATNAISNHDFRALLELGGSKFLN